MNAIILVIGLAALVGIGVHLARLVARDGLGTNPLPRSHREELGSWSAQEMSR